MASYHGGLVNASHDWISATTGPSAIMHTQQSVVNHLLFFRPYSRHLSYSLPFSILHIRARMAFLKHKFAHVIFPAINSSWAFHCYWDNSQSSLVRIACKAFHNLTLAPTGVMSAGPVSELPSSGLSHPLPFENVFRPQLLEDISCCEVDVPASVLLIQWVLSHVHVRHFIYILLLMLILTSFSFSFRKLSRNSEQPNLKFKDIWERGVGGPGKRCSMYRRTVHRGQ